VRWRAGNDPGSRQCPYRHERARADDRRDSHPLVPPRAGDPRADDAAVRTHRAESRAGGEALRHRRGAGLEPDPGPCPPPAASIGGGGRQPGDPHHPGCRLHPGRYDGMSRRINSLQLRLTVELAALFFVASCLAVGGLIYSASLTAGSVADRELALRAEDLARYVSLDESQKPRLDLPATLQQAYFAAAQQSVFAIRDNDGRLIEASTPEIGTMVARWPRADSEPSYFRLSNFGPSAQDYSGVSIRLDSAAGPLSVMVAEASGGDPLVHSILRDFVFDIAWYVPPFVAVALLLAAYSVRRSLLPLRAASAQASAIGPESIALRLPEANVPTEALPLVVAVNHALDRLEQGFVIQRRFTANAAHELRTPLTIITAR